MKLYGKNPVLERLRSNPKSIRKIFLEENFGDVSFIHHQAHKWNIPVVSVPRSKMIKLGKSLNTQGILVEIDEFCYTPFEDILENSLSRNDSIIFLDNLNDPQNLGAILRTLACLGGFSVVLPTHDSVEVTEAVLRVACGGDNYVPIAQVSNLNHAIAAAKKSGFWIAGTVVAGGKNILTTPLLFPLALVVGSEQKGIREILLKHLDLTLTLPMPEAKLSFNVSHATTIFAYEITRQKKIQKTK